jgi:urease accessory protein
MKENNYPWTSEFFLRVKKGQNRSIIDHVRFTAPFKIISPFYDDGQRLQVMLLSVAAGIMAGDTQQIDIEVSDGANLEIKSQSYEKIHKMNEGECAIRNTTLKIGTGAALFYDPLPIIPFAGSSFSGETKIYLHDETSRVFFSDILACGRAARQERFAYRRYHSRVRAYLSNRLIYADNTAFEPEVINIEGFCLYEGYTHLLNILIAGIGISNSFLEQTIGFFECFAGIKAGASLTGSGAVCVRALGNGSEPLIDLERMIKQLLML